MSKKHPKKAASVEAVAAKTEIPATAEATPLAFGCNEMLGELEAIVAEAEVRLAQDAQLM